MEQNLNATNCLPFFPSHGHGAVKANRPFFRTSTVGFSTSNFFLVVMQVNCTVGMKTTVPYSEYVRPPLQPNFDLHSDSDALWVEGVGYIAQYHCWCDMLYSHGVVYFLRDCLLREIAREGASDTRIQRLRVLNSKILLCESNGHGNTGRATAATAPEVYASTPH